VTSVEIQNPSAFHPLRVYTQDRARNVVVKATAPELPKRHTRAELEKIGAETVMVPSRGTARVDGVMKTVTRDVPTEFFRHAGYDSLAAFCTENEEKELREWQKAAAAAAMAPPRGERVVDSWSSPKPLQSIPPKTSSQFVHGVEISSAKAVFKLEENKRLLIECDEEVMLQIANTVIGRTIRLRNRNSKSGETTQVAFITYPNAAIVSANGRQSAVIELMAT
jgi:hypothetical protein